MEKKEDESNLNMFSNLSNNDRLMIEFEFVQNLSNPAYLHYLAQNKYLQDPKFINFLIYLKYWEKPEYIRHLVFPQCLAFLNELVSNPKFREVFNLNYTLM
jgi:mediator of RNA polymerase II transcription subunit 31